MTGLTPRQRQVMDLTSEGRGLREIAHRLGISVNTVKDHRRAAVTKLDAANIYEAIAKYNQGAAA